MPARHALLEIWPARVQELILDDGRVEFHPSTSKTTPADPIARSYPRSLLALERTDGIVVYGFPLPVDDAAGAVVRISDGRSAVDVEGATIRRTYTPNNLSLSSRVGLIRDILRERRPTRGRSPGPEVSGESHDLG
ncbi:MAG: hypothetical protein EA419_07375 [Wenzhouxiangella sp.]|nr:MAG: hypothetical protein EA419_07375 [Wenzhouxiangella sp.]